MAIRRAGPDDPDPVQTSSPSDTFPGQSSAIGPFIIGTIIGGIAGAIVGTALSPHTRGFLVGFYHLLNRRLTSRERDQLRFELLLQ